MIKNFKKTLIAFLVVAIFFLVGFFLVSKNISKHIPANIKTVQVGGANIIVDVAITGEQRSLGLSGRSGLKANEGMLFVFDYPNKYSFWMKDMNFPIDIIWIGENLRVVYIKKDARPELYPETYGPDKDTKYVLEVVAGFADKNNLKEGDKVIFTYAP